jgi:hypothetical protein
MRFVLLSALLTGAAFGATLNDPDPSQIDTIIAKFAAKEAAFSKARSNYTYRQTAKVMTLDDGGGTTGKWEEVTDILFLAGARIEKVAYAPPNTLTAIQLDPGDVQDLREVQPFVLTTDELPKYYIRYLGREQLDEIACYTFAVKPKRMESGQRYFEGIVWVDDRDLQIVKSYGRGEGAKQNADHQYPKFETYREQIDGKNWFPTYTVANATLHFRDNDQRIRMTVKYENYKQFKSDINIKYDVDDPSKTPSTTTPPNK